MYRGMVRIPLDFLGPSGYLAGNDWANEKEEGCRCFIFALAELEKTPNPFNPEVHVYGRT
jgi:hypothetical protein